MSLIRRWPLCERASQRKRTKKQFVWLLLFLFLLLLQRIAFTLRILYARRPPPLSEATRDPTEAESSKTNNKIKPLSIASLLRYVSMYARTTTYTYVCECSVCDGGGGGKCEIEKRRWSIASNPAERQQQQQQPRWGDIRVYRHRNWSAACRQRRRQWLGQRSSSSSSSGQGGWQRTGKHCTCIHTYT